MSTTFKLTYDPTEAKRGFELLAQSIRAAQAAGATLPPELVSIANRMEQVEVATADAAVDTNRLETEIEQLTAAARLADDRLGSYAISTQQVGNAATVAAAKVQQQASAIERTGKVVGSTREGLEKLTGAATALGNESAEVTKGMGILAGVIAAVASPIGAVVAIAASLVSIFKSLREGATGLADDMNPVDSVLLKIVSTMGLISEEAARAGETLKNDLATERFAENMKRGEAAAIAFAKAVMDVGKAIDAGRQSREEDAIINAIGDPEAIGQEIDRLREKMEGLANSQALSAEELEAYRERINKLETRRIALLDEQAAKEKEAAAKQQEAINKRIEDNDRLHSERMKQIEDERKAELAAINEAAKAREAEFNQREQQREARAEGLLAKLMGGNQDGGQGGGAVSAPSAGGNSAVGGQQRNPYGEGQAFEASGGNSPYAAAIDPLATALTGGVGEIIGETMQSATDAMAAGFEDIKKDLIEGVRSQILQDARASGKDITREQANAQARGIVNQDIKDGSIDSEQVGQAFDDMLRRRAEKIAEEKELNAEQTSMFRTMTEKFIEQNAALRRDRADIEAMKRALEALVNPGRPQFRGGNARRMGG